MTGHIPALPLSRKEGQAAIEAILAARKTIKVEKAPNLPRDTTADAGQKAAESLNTPTPITAEALTEKPVKGEVVQAATHVPDEEVFDFLEGALPKLAEIGAQLFEKPFNMAKAWAVAQRLMELISYAVAVGLPAAKDTEAKALVILIFRFIYKKFAYPALGSFLAPLLEPVIIKGLEALYNASVKKQAKKALAAGLSPFEYATDHTT